LGDFFKEERKLLSVSMLVGGRSRFSPSILVFFARKNSKNAIKNDFIGIFLTGILNTKVLK